MAADLIILTLELFSKILEAVHRCHGTKSKLGKIKLTENTYRILFDCCDMKMTFPKLKSNSEDSLFVLPTVTLDEEPTTKLEYEEVIFVDMFERSNGLSFESVFVNIEDEKLSTRDAETTPKYKSFKDGEIDPLLVEQNLVPVGTPSSLERNISKNTFKISSKNFLPKVVDWSCESIENIRKDLPNLNKKIKYPQEMVCEFCGLRFRGKDRVYNFFHHRNQKHTQEVHYTCPICKKIYWGERQLSAHIVAHTGKEFICEVCGIAFHRKNDLHRHSLTHADKSFSCAFCCKRFWRKDNLNIHERIHTGENLYKCNICEVGFPQKHQLNLHNKKCKRISTAEDTNKEHT